MIPDKLVEIINNTSIADDVKVHQISVQLSKLNTVELLQLNVPVDTTYQNIIHLLKTEQLIAQDPYNPSVKQLMESITPIGNNTPDFNNWFIKVKYNDLLTDVSYLITDLKYDNFVDLINKKLLNVKSIPLSNPYYSKLTTLIKLKILHLYLLSNYNFRNVNIANYLQENLNVEDLNEDGWRIFEMFKNSALISHDLFNMIVTSNFQDNYFKIIEKMDKNNLYMNILENNIIRLSKYYKTIKISRIGEMFQLQQKGINVDLEGLIFEMIISKKLNPECKIDQLENILVFEEQDNSIQLNEHVKQVGNLVNDITIRI